MKVSWPSQSNTPWEIEHHFVRNGGGYPGATEKKLGEDGAEHRTKDVDRAKDVMTVTDAPLGGIDGRQAKTIMGAQITKILDRDGLSTRQAEVTPGISDSEFSRMPRTSFSRLTIDRLMMILARLGKNVKILVQVHAVEAQESGDRSTSPLTTQRRRHIRVAAAT